MIFSLNYLLKNITVGETQEIKESLNLAEEEIKRLEIFGLSEYGKFLLFSPFDKKIKSVSTRRIKDYLKLNLIEEKLNDR